MYRRLLAPWIMVGALVAAGCDGAPASSRPGAPLPAPAATSAEVEQAPEAIETNPADAGRRQGVSRVTLIAGGDVSFGRLRGQRLLREPERNDFATVSKLLQSADLRFVNLECTISDQRGETQSPISKLVFTAPPPAAAALARADIDIVSLANNHAWDYGQSALAETFERLDAAGIAYVGAGRTRDAAYAPRVVEHQGFKIAFVAVTAIWNQELDPHPGREMVADAQIDELVASVRRARAIAGIDKVIVSHHGGYEYVDEPHPGSMKLLRAAIDAGADAVIGHHPHVVQRAESYQGKPILYSIGNLLMRMVTGKPWTQFGIFGRLTLHRDAVTQVAICPFRIHGFDPIPLAEDDSRAMFERHFRFKFERLLHGGKLVDSTTAVTLGDFAPDGCAPLLPTR